MTKADYNMLVADIQAQIAASGFQDRVRLRRHLNALHDQACVLGYCAPHPGARAEQDRIDETLEAQFENLPV